MSKVSRILSGIQTSGIPHVGNYFGAMKNWVTMQENKNNECLYMLADLHSLTSQPSAESLRGSVKLVAATLLAIGLDPNKVVLFRQSQVLSHCELAWILNCSTPMGWLSRMTQYKDKAANNSIPNTGLFTYPALMAADILLYQATHVPAGADQTQHVEFTRDLAIKFNSTYGNDVFTLPDIIHPPHLARVMSLKDGMKKMSKSDPSPQSRLELTDTADGIVAKIRKAKSDNLGPVTSKYLLGERPEVDNMIALHSSFANIPIDTVKKQFEGKNISDLKNALSESAVAFICPIGNRINELYGTEYVEKVIQEGNSKADAIASVTLDSVRRSVGLL